MKLNKAIKSKPTFTHEGAPASRITPEMALRRSVMANMLWEDTFYEDGESVATRIADLVLRVSPMAVADLAIKAREDMKLRHVPLLLVRELAKLGGHFFVGDTLARIIQRPDELTEFLALYWKDGRRPLAAQVKKGLAKAFTKFDAYQLAKYNRDSEIKLRDVLFLSHAKPKDEQQAREWTRLIDGTLPVPDTWEVALSQGGDKGEEFTRLLMEKKLGALALLRNLRNMVEAGVDERLINQAIRQMKTERVLPFRFVAAARYAPQFEPALEVAMFKSLEGMKKLKGKTALLIDVSGSMDSKISEKGDLTRMDAAAALAVLTREITDDVSIYTFSEKLVVVPPRRGFALRDAIINSQRHGGTLLGHAITQLNSLFGHTFDRVIVFTDEQSGDRVPKPDGLGYMINVASYKHGVGYGPWMHIDGFSEAILDYIQAYEELENGYLVL